MNQHEIENEMLEIDGDEDLLDEGFDIEEYDLTSTPNDFNILTINSFIESGAIKIPGFQRNYVWDIKRASKLIESIILGLPVPQIFLYEEKRNNFLVIDGQQRLMTIYYFMKQRFPRKEKRTQVRSIFAEKSSLPDDVLYSDDFFTSFKLSLASKSENKSNHFNGLTYKTLGQYQIQFDLRPIRNVVVKQNVPKDDNSSVFEIFNRLNSGGMNLMAQEIRSSLYHSLFYELLYRLNLNAKWRKILKMEHPDLHMKDIELLLRGFAFALKGDEYKASLAKFLNVFSDEAKKFKPEYLSTLETFFMGWLDSLNNIPEDAFINKRTKRFSTFLFEGILYAYGNMYLGKDLAIMKKIDYSVIQKLEQDSEFQEASIRGTTNKENVEKRLAVAKAVINGE
jgi:uncharacterized protein with ParB-like and HNH nuclease domain